MTIVAEWRRTVIAALTAAIFLTAAVAIGPVDAPEAAVWNTAVATTEAAAHQLAEWVKDAYAARAGTGPRELIQSLAP